MNETDIYKNYSLLWPYDKEYFDNRYNQTRNSFIIKDESVIRDLELENVAGALPVSKSRSYGVMSVLEYMTSEEEVIRYRLDIIEDLLNNESIYKGFERLVSTIDDLKEIERVISGSSGDMVHLCSGISELEKYVECVNGLHALLTDPDVSIKSKALLRLRDIFEEAVKSDAFSSLVKGIARLKEGLRGLKSVTVGINLNDKFMPSEAVLLSLNNISFELGTFSAHILEKIFGKNEFLGITRIQPGGIKTKNPQETEVGRLMMEGTGALLNRLIRGSLNYNQTAKFTKVDSKFLISLGIEMEFYIGAISFIKLMESTGMPVCKPEVRPADERICKIENLYNVNFVLRLREQYSATNVSKFVVTNDIEFGPNGRIFILTGPNQGGKTTFLQSIGIAQILFHLGVYVPGTSAVMSPVDGIFTHFPVEEETNSNTGRMGEECSRINNIFKQITSHSLVLLNETLSSTSPAEGICIAREIIAGFKIAGARVVFATHFHDLARNLDIFNIGIPGDSKVASLVSGARKSGDSDGKNSYVYERTYKVVEAPPLGLSYARDIAARYGVSIEKIIDKLSNRNIVNDDDINIEKIYELIS